MKILSFLACIAATAKLSMAFTVSSPTSTSRSCNTGMTTMKMGLFDGIMKAFENEEVRVLSIVIYETEKSEPSLWVELGWEF